MHLKSNRRMYGLCFNGGWWRWTHQFLLVIWLSLLAATPHKASGFFLGDTKAVLNGCEDHWTLQDRAAMPLLYQMTLCVDIRVVVPGSWVAFSYSSAHAPRPELGLEGDDEALYGWLLRVRHRFPIRLSPTHWHRVCLQRDVQRNSFSLEVDGRLVAERMVIGQAIPPHGSLWLGCRSRDRPAGAALGEVELYMFRMWADLGNHGFCEDGTVIGWNAQYWGVTSAKARQRDPHLQCSDHRRLRREARANSSITNAPTTEVGRSFTPSIEMTSTTTTSSPVIATSVTRMSNVTVSTSTGNTTVNNQTQLPSTNHSTEQTSTSLQNSSTTPSTNTTTVNPTTVSSTTPLASVLPVTAVPMSDASSATRTSATTSLINQTTPGGTLTSGSPLVNCNISQLCSNNTAYFWMSINVEDRHGGATERDVHDMVSRRFRCRSDGRGEAAHGIFGPIDFCQAARVNCSVKSNIRRTRCEVLLQFSRAVSACDLQRFGVSALQQDGELPIRATIIGEVKRVGRDVCGDVAPSSGGFVRCTSTSSMDDICRANTRSQLTCSVIDAESNPENNTESCSSEPVSGEAPRFCDCTAFCNSTSQFYAIRFNINSSSVNVSVLTGLLSGPNVARLCNGTSGSVCRDTLRHYQRAHLECHGTQQRLYSCMVILEMSGSVNGCFLGSLLQQLIDSNNGISSESPLARMVVCGPPGSAVSTLLASNLTWVASDLQTSDVCQPDPTLLKCEANESLAVLLTDGCLPEPPTTSQSNLTSTTPLNNQTGNHTTVSVTHNVTTTNNTMNFTTIAPVNQTTGTGSNVSSTASSFTTDFNQTTQDPGINSTTTAVNASNTNPMNNQTGNHTTPSVTHNVTTTNNTMNFTTVAPVNQTAGSGSNVSSTASSFTTDFNQTTQDPGSDSTTTAVNASSTTTMPAQINTTATLQTTTLASTTATTPGTTYTETSRTTVSLEVLEELADELLSQTEDLSEVDALQMTRFTRNLETILEGPSIPESVAQKTIEIISNLMEADAEIVAPTANRLIQLVDELGLKLIVASEKVVLSARLLVLAVKEVDGTNFPATSIDIFNTDNVQLRGSSRSRFKRSGSTLGSVFLPSSLTTGLSPEEQQQASRVQFNFYAKPVLFQDRTLDNQTIVSPVLAASVADLSISNLTENVVFTIRNINPIKGNYTASCVFWDFIQTRSGGRWNSDGCFVVSTTSEETTCSCNHLTSFAILLDLSRDEIDPTHQQILTFITYIGCGISAIFLAVTLLTYLSFTKLLRDIPAKILVQLCTSLLFLNLVFLVDGWLALYPAIGLCISTAFFLHYFLLTSFTWAGLEALHMYLSIVRVFMPYFSRYMLKISLVGWGVPLLVVIIIIAVDKDNYGLVTYGRFTDGTSNDFCWLRNDIAFYVGVVAYFLLMFVLCLLVFIVVMVQLNRVKKQNPQNQSPNRGVMTDMRSIAGLIVLLGLTWGFALFAWGPLYLPFVYLFSIFNSLQGFFVFVFHCAVKESVRREWRINLCCGKLRLAENSDWSRTATHRKRNLSSVTGASSGPHFSSRSISVNSDSTNSSDSVFVDSGISDGSNSESPTSDIHRQTLLLL